MVWKWIICAFLGTTASGSRKEGKKKKGRYQATYKAVARQAVKNQKTLRTEWESLL